MLNTDLPPRQLAALEFIRSFIASAGYPPTTREIAKALAVTQTAAIAHVDALERKGIIRTTPKVARSIVLL